MNKEELIKLIETLEFDEIIDIKMSYKKKKENRCYNLPLNKFYQDKSCLKYVEE